jgi:serine protease Do
MSNKLLLISGITVMVCLTVFSGCTTTTITTSSSSTPAQNTTTTTQPAAGSTTTTQIAVVNLPSFAALLHATENSVVKIDTIGTGTGIFGQPVQVEAAGSGWIMDSNGAIVTNNHVIEGATTITVTTLDGRTFPAQLVNADPVNDLALLQINATQLPVLKIGDASKLQAGDWVLAIGNPLGEGIIATEGIISRLGVSVSVSATETYNDLIETTAAINPGNSGGPLINLSGEVIGITTVKVSAAGIEGMGYAINMTDALPVIQKLSAVQED